MGIKSLFHASASLHCGAMLPPAFLLHGCSVFPAIGQPFLLVLSMGHVQTRLPAQKEAGPEFSCFWLGELLWNGQWVPLGQRGSLGEWQLNFVVSNWLCFVLVDLNLVLGDIDSLIIVGLFFQFFLGISGFWKLSIGHNYWWRTNNLGWNVILVFFVLFSWIIIIAQIVRAGGVIKMS